MPRRYHRKRRKPRGERTTPAGEHLPVLLAEVLATLNPQPGQTVVDCTLGFAGHSSELLTRIGPTGRLLATDLDPGNLPGAEERLKAVGNPFSLHHSNFAALPSILATEGITGVDAVLADLGMSSMQLDDRDRGFSFLRDGPLDMRMDPTRGRTAAVLVNTLSAEELATAFRELGDEPAADAIAQAIVARRAETPFARTRELLDVIEAAAPVDVVRGPGMPAARKQRLLPATRVFQSLRILVNRELANLEHLLRVLPSILNPGGVAAIISFHSGEDRLIKVAFRDGVRTGIYSTTNDEPIRPGEVERAANPRSRSAKLRYAIRA